jgi:predicted phage-related endonuclease
MNILTSDQRSTEWLLERRGRITASRICDVLAVLKRGGESSTRLGYKLQLIAERTTGEIAGNYVSPDMAYGTEYEQFARAEYEIESGNRVDQVGFVLHPRLNFSGASPDGLVGTDGAVEFKVPRSENHIRWMKDGVLPEEHEPQCAWVLACTERKWIDFVSFDPRQKELPRLFIIRMHRDEERIAQIEREVIRFDAEVEAVIADLRKRVKPEPPPPPRESAPESMSAWAEQFESEYGETAI